MPKTPAPTTANYTWGKVNQTRISVSVDDAIKLVTNPPRLILRLALADSGQRR